jgi:hypothetical protein
LPARLIVKERWRTSYPILIVGVFSADFDVNEFCLALAEICQRWHHAALLEKQVQSKREHL